MSRIISMDPTHPQAAPPRLLDQVALRLPKDMGAKEVTLYLSYLATECHVSPSTQTRH